MYTAKNLDNFKKYCADTFGISADDECFKIHSTYDFFEKEDTRRLFITWWFFKQAEQKKQLFKREYTTEELIRLENDNNITGVIGFWTGKEPFISWNLVCRCCNNVIKSIETPLDSECPEEFKDYQGDQYV